MHGILKMSHHNNNKKYMKDALANACKRAHDRQAEIELLQAQNKELKLTIAKLSDRASNRHDQLDHKPPQKKNAMNELNKIWEYITENDIATEEELQLVTNINGYNAEALNSVIYARTGYHSVDQYEECEG